MSNQLIFFFSLPVRRRLARCLASLHGEEKIVYSHMSGGEDIEPTVQTVRERQRCIDRIAWTEEDAVSNGATPFRDKMDYEAGVRIIIGESDSLYSI